MSADYVPMRNHQVRPDPAFSDTPLDQAVRQEMSPIHDPQGLAQTGPNRDNFGLGFVGPVEHDHTAPAGGSRAIWPTMS